MTKLLECVHTMLCVDDADRWGYWCKTCAPAGEEPEVIGNYRQRDSARQAARRHEETMHR